MVKAYVDDSMEHGQVLVMAGLVATPDRWEKFSVDWDNVLISAPWRVFKMAEAWRRGGVENEYSKWHYHVIRDHAQGGIAVAIPLGPLKTAVKDFNLPELSNPYIWGFRAMVCFTAQFQKEWGLHDPVDFIFDERGEGEDVRAAWDTYVATLPPEEREVTGRQPIFEKDDYILPLQGADMWAWCCRKQWLAHRAFTHDEFPIPWGKVGDFPRMSYEWGEPDIRREFAKIRAEIDSGQLVL